MDIAGLAVFIAALFVSAASPGPGIAAIIARELGSGMSGAVAFTSGVAFGDVVWLTFAVSGLAFLAQTFHGVFLAVKWAGICYLLYLAWRMWHAPAASHKIAREFEQESPIALFLAGLAVTMGNPKVMVFYLALLPTIIDLAAVTLLGFAKLAAAILIVLAVVYGGYMALAARARRLLTSPSAMRGVSRGSALAMAGVAIWVASR